MEPATTPVASATTTRIWHATKSVVPWNCHPVVMVLSGGNSFLAFPFRWREFAEHEMRGAHKDCVSLTREHSSSVHTLWSSGRSVEQKHSVAHRLPRRGQDLSVKGRLLKCKASSQGVVVVSSTAEVRKWGPTQRLDG